MLSLTASSPLLLSRALRCLYCGACGHMARNRLQTTGRVHAIVKITHHTRTHARARARARAHTHTHPHTTDVERKLAQIVRAAGREGVELEEDLQRRARLREGCERLKE